MRLEEQNTFLRLVTTKSNKMLSELYQKAQFLLDLKDIDHDEEIEYMKYLFTLFTYENV